MEQVRPEPPRPAPIPAKTPEEERLLALLKKPAVRKLVEKLSQQGAKPGRVRYGYRAANGSEVPDKEEQSILARMRKMKENGATYQDISDAMNCEGITTHCGKRFRLQYVANFLKASDR